MRSTGTDLTANAGIIGSDSGDKSILSMIVVCS